jgi:DNA-binding MarR family transcriptional regulator
LRNEQSDSESVLSSPSSEELAIWRVFLECALALPDVLGSEMEGAGGLSLRWYDVLVNLEEAGEGVPMNEIASRILASKSGLTRVIDRMEKAGYVRRERIEDDRRVVLVHATEEGLAALHASRQIHRDGIQRHFSAHLSAEDHEALRTALEKVRTHVRPLRPGRVSGG